MNEVIQALFEVDQQERKEHPVYGSPEYWRLRERDAQRRRQLLEIIENNGLSAPEDYYHAAMVFQHGETVVEIQLAHTLAKHGAELGYRPARWLAAASLDRWLMYQGKPQKYGTQVVPDGKKQRVWDVDPTTTDRDRAKWDVPPLAEMHQRAEQVTKTEPMPPMDHVPWWLKEAIKRWSAEEDAQ
ncbi:hypothetical protein GWO43_20385 [candidate division KSB1 bacterium]|nr:hypothetical protein [candidate division KSB1 bacterium]NIR68905.1 hypothetical protein [candidate division KSB1 bacterium]NIS24030.1 hypothetical protein [candidate division KSB1 bacterium]NIT73193.1 hypothetical protein [candidate division KSB1 bacterium]NIU24680.1 hypothetical protein [candidate division KSB1 bacterium]